MEQPQKDKSKEQDGRELETMKFIIGDDTRHTLQVSIRNEYGLRLNLKIFDVVLIKGTHVNAYLNQKSVDSGSGIIVNPDINQALVLLQDFEKIVLEDDDISEINTQQDFSQFAIEREEEEVSKKNDIFKQKKGAKPNNKEFTQVGDNRVSVHYYEVKTINYVVQQVDEQLERVIRLSLTHSPTDPEYLKEFNRCIYSEIEGEVYSAGIEKAGEKAGIEKKPYYVACSVCQKKIENYPHQTQCFKRCYGSLPIARMTTNLNIADSTGAVSALAFNEQCQELFGFDAEFLKILDEANKNGYYHKNDPTCRDFIRQSFTHKYRFRLLSGVQIYEKKIQAKNHIVGCTRINNMQHIQETAKSIEMHIQNRVL